MKAKLLHQLIELLGKASQRAKVANITDLFTTLLNNVYIMRGGKAIASILLEPGTFSVFARMYNSETVIPHDHCIGPEDPVQGG